MTNKSYAGVGSRQTPNYVCELMTDTSRFLSSIGYVLRSGGASGADVAFEAGVEDSAKKQIFLPWNGFNKNPSRFYNVANEAMALAENFHPAWRGLSHSAKLLHSRNCYQVLGEKLDDPVEFLICWTKGGLDVGGTAQALRIARHYDIPVFNLFCSSVQDQMRVWKSTGKVIIDRKKDVESCRLI